MSEEKGIHPTDTTVVGTGDAVGVSERQEMPRRWYIARVMPNTEKASRDRLFQMGFEAYVASQEEIKTYKNGDRKKRKKIERVVITQYVFIHVTESERRKLVELPFIRCFLVDRSFEKRTLAVVPDEQMRRLKLMLGYTDHQVQFAAADFTLGEEVIVSGLGNFDYTGHVVRLRGDNLSYIGVRIDALGCAYLEIPPANIISTKSQNA